MPDLALYLYAMCLCFGVSASIVLILGCRHRTANAARVNLASVLGIGVGLFLGYRQLNLWSAWPPTNGLGRLLWIVFPAALTIELVAIPRLHSCVVWLMRFVLAGVTGRILLHASSYLSGPRREWTPSQGNLVLLTCGVFLAVVWRLCEKLGRRSPGATLPLSLVLAIQSAGVTIMLAGYLSGGVAAFPLVAVLCGVTLATSLVAPRPNYQGSIGIGVIGLFSLLFIGRFFGALSTPAAVTMMLAPLMCWIPEIPLLHPKRSLWVGMLRLVLVAIPLGVVIILAKFDFDRDMKPLLGW